MSFISEFIASAKRIYTVSKKPTTKEFLDMSKITGIGIIIIGLIGYIITFIFQYFALWGIKNDLCNKDYSWSRKISCWHA